jgi:hypothetical protein
MKNCSRIKETLCNRTWYWTGFFFFVIKDSIEVTDGILRRAVD